MPAVALYLQNDRPARAEEFEKAAVFFLDGHRGNPSDMWPVYSSRDLLEPAKLYEPQSVTHLGIFAHGTPETFGRPGRFGVSTIASPKYETLASFAALWGPLLAPNAILSLGCCLCSRDPKWYRIQLWGKDVSAWSPKSYEDGGSRSVAAQLVRAFESFAPKRGIEVRGHCAAGHTIYQALLRSHLYSDHDGLGKSLFGLVGCDQTAEARKRWQAAVKGPLAARWLCGVSSLKEIREAL